MLSGAATGRLPVLVAVAIRHSTPRWLRALSILLQLIVAGRPRVFRGSASQVLSAVPESPHAGGRRLQETRSCGPTAIVAVSGRRKAACLPTFRTRRRRARRC